MKRNYILTKYIEGLNELKIFTILIGMLFIAISSPAQTGVSTIRKYGDYLKGWMEEGNHEQREKITKMCEGNIKTRVDDQLLKEFLRLSNKTLAEGDKMMDTYLNGFESLNGKTKILFSNIRVLSEEEVPHIKIGKEKPKQYVTADITLDNKNLKFFGSDLFWVRGKMITNILDNSDDISIGKAIRLYAMKRYEEAFRMFRTLAYQDVFNYEAQYYTAVMELKNQGCSFLAPEVRDAECLWLCTKSFVVSNQSESCKNMNSLFLRFTMDERKNVYFGMDRYKWTFLFYKLINQGLMPFRKVIGDYYKYGFMKEDGQIVVQPEYEIAFPFGRNGLALVQKNSKYGFIDTTGKVVIPFGAFDSYCRGFNNGNNIVCKDNTAYLINKEGNIIKTLVTGHTKMYCSTDYYGNYLVVQESIDSGMRYIFKSDGELFWKGNAVGYNVSLISGNIAMGDDTPDNNIIKETEIPYNW